MTDENVFTGQASILATLSDALQRNLPRVHFLHGLPGCGKTALLQQLETLLPQRLSRQTLYFQPTAEQTLTEALQTAGVEVDIEPEALLPNELTTPLVLLIDTDPAGDDAALYSRLQDRVKQFPERLQVICALNQLLPPPGSDTHFRVPLLDAKAASQLSRLLLTEQILTEDALRRVTDFTGGHPGLIHALCGHLIQESEGVASWQAVEAAAQQTLLNSDALFTQFWRKLSPLERVSISLLAGTATALNDSILPSRLAESGIRLDPVLLLGTLERLETIGLVTSNNGDYTLPIGLLQQWLIEKHPSDRLQHELERLDPKTPTLFRQARELHRQKQPDAAIEALREAIERNPNHVGSYQLLADILLGENALQAALSLLESLYPHQPAAARGRLIEALLKLANQDIADNEDALALHRYQRVLRLSPGHADAFEGVRRLRRRQGDQALAADALGQALDAYRQAEDTAAVAKVEALIEQRRELAEQQRLLADYLRQNTLDALQQGVAEGERLTRDETTAVQSTCRRLVALYAALGNALLETDEPQAEEAQHAYLTGADRAESFLTGFPQDAWLREQLLHLTLNAALVSSQHLNDTTRASEVYNKAVTHGERFFRAGETHADVRAALMCSYLRAGRHFETFDNARAATLFADGIACGELFIRNGEQDPTVNALLLNLYLCAALNAPSEGHIAYEYTATRFFTDGIAQAELVLDNNVPIAVLLEPTLALYFHAALQQPGNAKILLNKGIALGEAFFAEPQTADNLTVLRHYFLRLFVNIGGMKWFKQGIDYARKFIAEGETHPKIYEYALLLYLNLTRSEAAANVELIWYEDALALGEQCGCQHLVTPAIQDILLRLYLNAGLHTRRHVNDPARAQAFYWAGIRLADSWSQLHLPLTCENYLRLYLDATDNAERSLHSPDLARQLIQRGVEKSRQWLDRLADSPSLRSLLMALHAKHVGLARTANETTKTQAAFAAAIDRGVAIFNSGETRNELQIQFLALCLNCGKSLAENPVTAKQCWETGVVHGDRFLQNGANDNELRRLFLQLCVEIARHAPQQAADICNKALLHALTFSEASDCPPDLHTLLLELYLRAGLAVQDTPDAAQRWWRDGVHLGRTVVLPHNEVESTARRYLQQMQLLIGLNDAACTATLEERRTNRQAALRVIKNRQREGVLPPELYEQVLQLYADAAAAELDADQKTTAQALFQEAIAQGGLFLRDAQVSPVVALQVLRLYYDAAFHAVEPETAQQYYLKGIAHAHLMASADSSDEEVQQLLTSLYQNAALNATKALGDDAQAHHHYRAVIAQLAGLPLDLPNATALRSKLPTFYLQAGLHAERCMGAPMQAQQFYRDGLEAGRADPAMPASKMLELFLQAGFNNAFRLQKADESLKYYREAIGYGEQQLLPQENNPLIRHLLLTHYLHYFSVLRHQGRASEYLANLPQHGFLLWSNLHSESPVNAEENLKGYRQDIALCDADMLYHDFQAYWQKVLSSPATSAAFQSLPGGAGSDDLHNVAAVLYYTGQYELQAALRHVVRAYRALRDSISARQVAELAQRRDMALEQLHALWPRLLRSKTPPAPEAVRLPLSVLGWRPLRGIRYASQWRRYRYLSRMLRTLPVNQGEWRDLHQTALNGITDYLQQNLATRLPERWQGLRDPASLALAMVFIAQREQFNLSAMQVLQLWQQKVLWQQPDLLQEIFENSQVYALLDIENREILPEEWLGGSTPALEMTCTNLCAQQSGRLPRAWFLALRGGNSAPLANALQGAWRRVCDTADRLAPLLVQLSPTMASEIATQRARLALLSGNLEAHLKIAITHYLYQFDSEHDGAPHSLSQDLARLQRRFDAMLGNIDASQYVKFSDLLYAWSEQRFVQLLAQTPLDLEALWQALEYTRLARLGGYVKLPPEIIRSLSERLLNAMHETAEMLSAQHCNGEWPPLQCWLDVANMLPPLPSIEDCRAHLGEHEALVQYFFDPHRQRLRVLWLDQNGLALRELPAECSHQNLWIDESGRGLLQQWWRAIQENRFSVEDRANLPGKSQAWLTVMESTPLLQFAQTLRHWADAANCERLSVILPACFDQLPWEAEPALEGLLTRVVSLTHWQGQPRTQLPVQGNLILDVPQVTLDNRYADDIMRQLGKHWDTVPRRRMHTLEVLEALAGARYVYLNAATSSSEQQPMCLRLTEGMSRHSGQLPMWAVQALRVPAQLLILDNVPDDDPVSEQLSPASAAASLAAAGANAVVAMLWPCDRLALLCFLYYFLRELETDGRAVNYHQAATEARQQLRSMSFAVLEHVARELGIDEQHPGYDEISAYADSAICPDGLPFSRPVSWAGFVVWGR